MTQAAEYRRTEVTGSMPVMSRRDMIDAKDRNLGELSEPAGSVLQEREERLPNTPGSQTGD